jgi:hypothetical protein
MKLHRPTALGLLVTALLVAAPARGAGPHYSGWGPRFGLADDPDQIVVGVHFDLGELARHLRFVPNVELGVGDDATVLAMTAPVHYRWEDLEGSDVVPYAGGGLTAALVDWDDDRGGDDDDLELGARAIGGAEWSLDKPGNAFLIEVNVGFGDIHDLQIMVGWKFGR